MGFVCSAKGFPLIFIFITASEIADAAMLRRNYNPIKKTRQLKHGRVAWATHSGSSYDVEDKVVTFPSEVHSTPFPPPAPAAGSGSTPSQTKSYVSSNHPSALTCYGKTKEIQISNYGLTSPINMFEFQAFSNGSNVAPDGYAWQSLTLNGDTRFGADKAIDNLNSTFSHTTPDNPIWLITLDRPMRIDSITILNRWCVDPSDPNGCLCRLSGFHVSLYGRDGIVANYVLGNTCGQKVLELSFSSNPDCDTFSPTVNPNPWPSYAPTTSIVPSVSTEPTSMRCYGRANRISVLSKSGKPLQMFELQAITSYGVNVAVGQTAYQSSTFNDNAKFGASMASDGDNSTFSHTKAREQGDYEPEWDLYFDQPQDVQTVTILNRYCKSSADPSGCLCRLSGAVITHVNTDGQWNGRILGDTCNQTVISVPFTSSPHCPTPTPTMSPTIKCYPKARKLQIASKSSKTPINMFEFQAFAEDGTNLALDGIASQSSTLKDDPRFGADKAIDNLNSTFSHTSPDDIYNHWWELDLNGHFNVERVTILNRWCADPSDPNGCLCRLSDYGLFLYSYNEDWGYEYVASESLGDTCDQRVLEFSFVSNPECSVANLSPGSSTPKVFCNQNARSVLLTSGTDGSPIQMFELEAYSFGSNVISLGGSAFQSSTYKDNPMFGADKSIDGDNSTFSHTSSDGGSYWQVDFDSIFELDSVRILNRFCGDLTDEKKCLCRLSGATLSLLDESGKVVYARQLGDTCDQAVIVENFVPGTSCTTSIPP